MENNFRIHVNEEIQFDLSSKDVEDLDIVRISKNKFHLLQNNQSYIISTSETHGNKEFSVLVNGNKYRVKIQDDLDLLIEDMGLSLGSKSVENEIYAPMPGIILEVRVSEGQEVEEGDYLCVLEAMKMENALTSPRKGKIKSVHISQGETVDKGKLLIEFEE